VDITKEMLAFSDWLETNPLEPSAQTLWMHLLVLANKSGCPEWFAVANPLLQAKVGVSENTLNKHRNYLVQKGRLEYKSQGKKQVGKYKIIPFTSKNAVMQVVKGEVNCAAIPEVKGSALFKDLSSSTSSSSDADVYESFYAAHIRVFGFACNPMQSQMLGAFIDQDGIDEKVVIRAIERAAARSTGYNFKLITRILDDYAKSGVRTLQQAEAIDAAFDARTQRKPAGQQQADKAHYFAEQARKEREREQSGNLEPV
jgi:DnaD/phage-associated family protein